MQAPAVGKTWEKTRLQHLMRHKSGRYYARLYRHGKERWRALKTDRFSVTEARLAVLQKEHRQQRAQEVDPANARMTFAQAASLHLQPLDEDVSLKDVSLKRLAKSLWRSMT